MSYADFVQNPTYLHTDWKPINPAPQIPNFKVDTEIRSMIISDALISDELANAISTGEILETMDYAAGTLTFTVTDRKRTLLKGLLAQWVSANHPRIVTSVVGQRRHKVLPTEWNEIYATFDGRDYALVQVRKNGDQFDLTFENRSIHELRRYSKPKVWYRDQYTRAEVFRSMCHEVDSYFIDFYAPELDVVQPVNTPKSLPSPREHLSKKRHGFPKGYNGTIHGKKATKQQVSHISSVLRVADSTNEPHTVRVAALISVIEMSQAKTSGYLTFTQGGGSGLFGFLNSTDPVADSKAFFKNANRLYSDIPGISAQEIAWNVVSGQRSGEPFKPTQFARWISEAEKLLSDWGELGRKGSVTYTEYNRYAFKRGLDGKREDSWDCMVRLAKEVNSRVFSTDNILWYVSDNDLRFAVPWDTISEETPGIDTIDYEIDTGKAINEVTITAHLSKWQVAPGVPIIIDEDGGPADGRWLVFEVRRPLDTDVGEITCHLPSPPLPEPAPTTKRVTVKGKYGSSIIITGNSKVDAVYAKAKAISNKHFPYVFGGGHGTDFSPTGGGYDCSGYVSACLNAGGMLPNRPEATPALGSWGQAGPGKLMTVWVNPNPGTTGHTFIEFKLPAPYGHMQANTSHSGVASGQGALLLQWGGNGENDSHSPAFHARHWPGT